MGSNIIDMHWLKERLHQENLVIVDCRFHLTEPDKGYEEYKKEHIPGALFFDLEKDLSGPVGKHGGRHPLPDAGQFSSLLERSGITKDSTVIAYDDQSGGMAAHLWWMLKYFGHSRVYVMKEGFTHWKAAGYPIDDQVPGRKKSSYTVKENPEMLASMEDVQKALHDPEVILMDSRAEERFLGISEPFDPIAGHIPGAANEDWQDRSASDGRLKDKKAWQNELKSYVNNGGEVIVYCGSGVTACVNVLALAEAGREAKLYAGSWSDWSSYENNPVGRKPK